LQDVLENSLGYRFRGQMLIPFFVEGGRFTIDDVHWVQDGEWLVPAAQTEYAQDAVFGYGQSNLRSWIEEKTGGRIQAGAVQSITLDDIRRGGPDRVSDRLREIPTGCPVIVNAASYRDLEVIVAALLRLEDEGTFFLFRTAASFVRTRGGITPQGLLTSTQLYRDDDPPGTGGLIVVGSYIQKTTAQVQEALALTGLCGVELDVQQVLTMPERTQAIARAAQQAEAELRRGREVMLYTSRRLVTAGGAAEREPARQEAENLRIGQLVSSALVETVTRLTVKPRFVVAKGGITSSDIATQALGVKKARVAGQILPGVPVWRLGPECRFPGVPYVVFPGNVGDTKALAKVVEILRNGC
jgi:uncharacterized protein YgbK (DUF1537 family)